MDPDLSRRDVIMGEVRLSCIAMESTGKGSRKARRRRLWSSRKNWHDLCGGVLRHMFTEEK